ncbi:MAG: esterase-like activity of phytase family protein, partial [Aliarcobacter sp.]|nr:esterase-like activity of phytase family protein [Aliarcobacter sp.]
QKINTSGSALPYTVLDDTIDNGLKISTKMEIRNGGFGSAAFKDPHNINRFFAITDRGPNAGYVDENGVSGKMFPTPDYTPRLGHFEIQQDGSIKKIAETLFKDRDGNLITGLPNPVGIGGTKEVPFDKNGLRLTDESGADKTDIYGLDSEGLVVLKDGSFWVSDEYGPHIVHFDVNGKEIDRINAFSDDTRTSINLPAEFANRWANRGMEGLAITPDEKTLVGIMQSSLDNPKTRKDLTRIVTINLETKEIKQYLYKQDKDGYSNSEITAIDNDTFLVIERDGKFFQKDNTAVKNIYKIKLSTGTELENIALSSNMQQDSSVGLTIDGKTLETISAEENGWETLASDGIVPVSKTLIVDMIAEVAFPHDKMEGLIIFNDSTLGVINDDDFATWATNNILEQKYLDSALTKEDGNTLYIIKKLDLK